MNFPSTIKQCAANLKSQYVAHYDENWEAYLILPEDFFAPLCCRNSLINHCLNSLCSSLRVAWFAARSPRLQTCSMFHSYMARPILLNKAGRNNFSDQFHVSFPAMFLSEENYGQIGIRVPSLSLNLVLCRPGSLFALVTLRNLSSLPCSSHCWFCAGSLGRR